MRGAYNAVFVESEAAGQLMFYGPGAGGAPTASAVLGDLVTVARNRLANTRGAGESAYADRGVQPMGETRTRYHVAIDVDDKAGVLAAVANAFADHDVSIQTVRQEGRGADAQLVVVSHAAAGRRAGRDGRAAAQHGHRPRGHLGDARRGRGRVMAHGQWLGVIEEYRDLLDLPEGLEAVTLREGGTPLVHSDWLSGLTGAEVWLKVEANNPTGSFKDRGMTAAISVAKHEGAEAVVCASTGNTSASMAAYAAKAGIKPLVLIPEGKIAAGKMAQAVVHGAQIIMVRGNFDHCLDIARGLARDYPVALVNSVNPVRLQGQKTASFEVCDFLGDAPDYHLLPVGNAGNIAAYWLGYQQYADLGRATRRPVMRGFQAEGAAPLVTGEPFPDPETKATAIRVGNPASWHLAEMAAKESEGRFAAVSDAQILAAQAELARRDGVFVEPASAAGIAGLLSELAAGESYAGKTVVITVTGHGLKDTATALESHTRLRRHGRRRRRRRRCRRRRSRLSMTTFVEGPVRVSVPGHVGQPRSRASTRSGSPCRCATSSRPRCCPTGWSSRSRAPAPTAYPATSRTWSCGPCGPPST